MQKKFALLLIAADAVGGLRKHVHYIAREAIRRGQRVHYVHGESKDSVALQELPELAALGCTCVEIPIPKSPAPADLGNAIRLLRYCVANRIDLVHGHGAKGGLYARVISALLRVPSIYTAHGGSVHARYGRIESLAYKLVERGLKPFTTLFVFESKYTLDAFVKVAGRLRPPRYVVNSNGLNLAPYSNRAGWLPVAGMRPKIACIGVLRSLKGQDVLVAAVDRLRQAGRDVEVHFYGDGPDGSSLRELAASRGLNDRIFFHGDTSDIVAALEAANLVAVPSRFESFGYVAVEAFAMRRPVIAANVGGLREVVIEGQTGRLFPVADADALANTIGRVLDESGETNRLVDQARQTAEQRYDVRRSLDILFSAYEDCLKPA